MHQKARRELAGIVEILEWMGQAVRLGAPQAKTQLISLFLIH